MNSGKRASTLAVLVIVLAALAAYANSFRAPFVFDDLASIVDNPTIRQLWPPGGAFTPPPQWGLTVSGRPVLNFSLALNYAISGLDVWSYHALNLLIHILAGLTLFGIVRRTAVRPSLSGRLGHLATPLACVVALVWALHPLQTEAVTYIVQRAESLMALFFLLTLYAFVRALDSPRPHVWRSLSFLACLLGVGTKEVAAVAPVVVLLYDRSFVSGSFREAWRRHGWHLAALATTWLPLVWLIARAGSNRGGTAGFGLTTSPLDFWLTQFEAITRYVGLAFWPHPLVFDYGKIASPGIVGALPWAIPVFALALATLVALARWPAAGFLGASFFCVLAPTSLVPAVIQMIVEHRMYLPLAAIVALVFGAIAHRFGKRALLVSGTIVAFAAAQLTFRRNADYVNEWALWEGALASRPDNARAHNNLGTLLFNQGRLDEAIARYRESLRLNPGLAQTNYNLGLALMNVGRNAEAIAPFEEAVRILPYFYNAHLRLGVTLTKIGRPQDALPHFAEALRTDPSPAETRFQAGVALAELHREREAIEQFRSALQLNPELPGLHFHLGLALANLGRAGEAQQEYADAVRLEPTNADAHLNLGIALAQSGNLRNAIEHLGEAARLQPKFPEAHCNLASALVEVGMIPEAISHAEVAIALRPDYTKAHYTLALALLQARRIPEGTTHLETALHIDPSFEPAREMLQQIRTASPPGNP